jgi:ribosomal protein S18 acetylase RimI-like enzyme
MAVHPGFRRRRQISGDTGVGEQLSRALIEDAHSAGYAGVILRTHVEANAARRMYAKIGFQELPVRDSEHRDRSYWFLRF